MSLRSRCLHRRPHRASGGLRTSFAFGMCSAGNLAGRRSVSIHAFLRPCPVRLVLYVTAMTQAVARILSEVEQLSDTERRELRCAIVERVPMSDDLTDDDFAALAAASFRALDKEEEARGA